MISDPGGAESPMPPAFLNKLRTVLGTGNSVAGKKVIRRESRYVIRGHLIYRPAGGMDWHKGLTENLSSTGVLFRGEAPLPVNTPLEMSITPPKAPGQRSPEGIFCWGKIVRASMDSGTSIRPMFGVKIDKYRTPPKFLTDAAIKYERLA